MGAFRLERKKEFYSAQVKLFSTTSTKAVFPLRMVPLLAVIKNSLKIIIIGEFC